MKTLYSLGDSFMTTDDPDGGVTSFCELYCEQKQFRHVSLARPGATNFAIRLQIDQAIKERADYVVTGITCSDRFDVVLNIDEQCGSYVLPNILYRGYRAASEKHVDQKNIKIVSDTFVNLTTRHFQKELVSDDQLAALKSYLTYLHNITLAAQKDYYIICDGVRHLQHSGIEFLLIPGWMGHRDWSWVKRVWPSDQVSPYQMPYGPSGWDPETFTGTHNPAHAHREFCETMLKLTTDWH